MSSGIIYVNQKYYEYQVSEGQAQVYPAGRNTRSEEMELDVSETIWYYKILCPLCKGEYTVSLFFSGENVESRILDEVAEYLLKDEICEKCRNSIMEPDPE